MINTTYTLTLLTQYSKEPVEDYNKIKEKLKELAENKQGFVRLEVRSPQNGRRYIETIFDATENQFVTYVLEDGYVGQFFWVLYSEKVPRWRFKRVMKRRRIDPIAMYAMYSQEVGVQRKVVAEGMNEKLSMKPFEIQSTVYNEKGLYGGDQTRLTKVPADSVKGKNFRAIIRKYYPDYQEPQIQALLQKLDSEGCGYVVIVNTLLEHFEGRPEAFEQTFGIPMYAADGDLNYDALLLDFYAATDNHYSDKGNDKIDFEEDKNDKEVEYDYSMDTTGIGTTFDKRIYRTKLYLKGKNIRIEFNDNMRISLGCVRTFSELGRIMISLKGGNVQNEDGSVYSYCPGHAMIITGVTEDCRYIVSTWGMKKYVDPFEVVEKDGKKTRIYYQFFEVKE